MRLEALGCGMTRGKRNPFEEIESLIDRMSRGFGTDLGRIVSPIALDVADHGTEFVVTADLPGFEKSDIDVTIAGNSLRIEANRESDVEQEDARYLRRERRQESVSRSIQLPDPVDEEEIEAAFSNGVLTVTLPKQAADHGHQIEIE